MLYFFADFHTKVIENIIQASSQPCPLQKGYFLKSGFGTLQTHACTPVPPGIFSISALQTGPSVSLSFSASCMYPRDPRKQAPHLVHFCDLGI